MPTYNRGSLLPRAIDSLIAQTCKDWELVIVDDGSVDETAGVIREYMSRESRIRYIHQRNLGLSRSRNNGLRASQGELVTFLDSDDEYGAEHLELRLQYMNDHPDVDMIHGGVKIVGGSGFVPDRICPEKSIPLEECYIGGTFFMKRMVFLQLGGFRRPDYGDDYEFMMRALKLFRIEKVSYATYIYHRETPDSLCNLMAEQQRNRKPAVSA